MFYMRVVVMMCTDALLVVLFSSASSSYEPIIVQTEPYEVLSLICSLCVCVGTDECVSLWKYEQA